MAPKGDRNTTLIRILSLLRVLHRRGAMSIEELAAASGVHKRTIYRDLSALEAAHIPLLRKVNEWDGVNTVKYDRFGSCPVCATDGQK